jgi:hypothetical protein
LIVNWRCRHVRLAAQAHGESVDRSDILAVLPFDNCANCTVRALVCLGSYFFNTLNFLLTRSHVRSDRVLGARDVARRIVTPSDCIPKLLLMCLHRLGCPLDRSTCCF